MRITGAQSYARGGGAAALNAIFLRVFKIILTLHSEVFGVNSLFFQHDHVARRVSLSPSNFVWVDRRWASNPW